MQEDSNGSMIKKREEGNEISTGKRGRKTGAGRREREVGSSSTESAGASSSYGEDEPQDIRRSTRQKKPVNYTEADNDMDQPADQKDERPSNKEAGKVEASNDQFRREDALAGGDKHKEHNLECQSLEETSGQDDLESGLCLIEDENRQQQAGFHEDYVKMGGGFCMDEDDNARIDEEDSRQERVSMAENLDVASVDEGICKGSVDESGKADETTGGNFDLEFDSGRAFIAMPYLRRKRRKC